MTAPYLHVVLDGPAELVRGFLLGVAAAEQGQPVVFADEAGLHERGLARRFAELLHIAPEKTEALIPEALLPKLQTALERGGRSAGIEIERSEKIGRAHFNFEFEVFNQQEAEQIRQIFNTEHPGIEFRNLKQNEKVHPEAHGSELYTPEHEYIFSGSGVVAGGVAGVFFVHEALASHPQVEVQPIELERE